MMLTPDRRKIQINEIINIFIFIVEYASNKM